MTHSPAVSDRLIVALDMPGEQAVALAKKLAGSVGWVKVGMTLFYEKGPGIVTEMTSLGLSVFIDLKLHDIPHQVLGAARSLSRLGAGMLTVHASGGAAMIAAAVEGAALGAQDAGTMPPAVLAVTVLTSSDADTLSSVGVADEVPAQVRRLASLAIGAGADGLVCSPREATIASSIVGPAGLVVTPGVRPVGSAHGDQARVATPQFALANGATHLVIGRPITGADHPTTAARAILEQMTEAYS